jgi:hypothetical protein
MQIMRLQIVIMPIDTAFQEKTDSGQGGDQDINAVCEAFLHRADRDEGGPRRTDNKAECYTICDAAPWSIDTVSNFTLRST